MELYCCTISVGSDIKRTACKFIFMALSLILFLLTECGPAFYETWLGICRWYCTTYVSRKI